MLTRDSLRGPLDWIEVFGSPGILHLHLRMALTQFVRGFDSGEEGGDHYLNRLAMQRETPFGRFLQSVSSRPLHMVGPCGFVRFHTRIPDLRCLHLGRFAALELFVRQVIELVDSHRFHGTSVP